jgi:DNA replication and repair protein RecF
MFLSSLLLQNFRNYSSRQLDFSPTSTILIGPNTAGKTNVLEAIYLLASGRSPRVSKEEEMIFYSSPLARVTGQVVSADKQTDKLEILLTRGEVAGRPAAKKRYSVNDVARRMTDFIGRLRAVFFRPEDLDIVLGSPSRRREWLDDILNQISLDYRRSHLAYKKGIRQRNRILQKIREQETDSRQLFFWDQLLLKNGEIIRHQRQELLEFINHFFVTRSFDINLEYDQSVISEERLAKYRSAEIASGQTLVGPHRDDVIINKFKSSKGTGPSQGELINLAHYGSRGEQRLGVLFLKLAELEYITLQSKEKPVLLLDDIFSELDEKHRDSVIQVTQQQPTIMTTTESDWFAKGILDKMVVLPI